MRSVVFAIAIALGGPALASTDLSDIEIKPGRISPSDVAASATFTLKNNGVRTYHTLVLACALLDSNGAPIDTTKEYLDNVLPGATIYGSAQFMNAKTGNKLECRPSSSY